MIVYHLRMSILNSFHHYLWVIDLKIFNYLGTNSVKVQEANLVNVPAIPPRRSLRMWLFIRLDSSPHCYRCRLHGPGQLDGTHLKEQKMTLLMLRINVFTFLVLVNFNLLKFCQEYRVVHFVIPKGFIILNVPCTTSHPILITLATICQSWAKSVQRGDLFFERGLVNFVPAVP